jgi:hypothetical protein
MRYCPKGEIHTLFTVYSLGEKSFGVKQKEQRQTGISMQEILPICVSEGISAFLRE